MASDDEPAAMKEEGKASEPTAETSEAQEKATATKAPSRSRSRSPKRSRSRSRGRSLSPPGFVEFQRKYLAVFLVVMLADWMQGTNMWTLYASYGVDIGTLFLTGFICSAVFSLFAGSLVDKFGRKRGCLLYCALEVVINVLEHYPTFEVLWVGRVMGGFSTCLLFSVFESWYVSAHRARKYPEELIEQTFSKATQGNGLAAVVAGLLAQVAADAAGEIGPFQAAIALTVLAAVLVALFFDENYGDQRAQDQSLSQSFSQGLQTLKSPPVMLVAMGGTFYEGATYTFVFMWVPVMIGLVGTCLCSCTRCVFTAVHRPTGRSCRCVAVTCAAVVGPQGHHPLYPPVWSFLASCSVSP